MQQVMSLEAYKCDTVLRHELGGIKLPPETKTYCPIPHDYLVDTVDDCLSDIGFRFGEQHHGLSHDGQRYFGIVELLHQGMNETYSLLVGIRNSLDKRFPAGVTFGSRVMVCANLCFGGEQTVTRKHTAFIMRDLPHLIYGAVSNLKAFSHNQDLRYEAYQDAKLSQKEGDHLLMNLLRAGAINTSRVEKVINEWDEPSHDEFLEGGRTVWRMFNAMTEALKGHNIHELPKRHMNALPLLDRAAGFKPVIEMPVAA